VPASSDWETDLKRAKASGLSQSYLELLKLCELVLRNRSLELGHGWESYAFLINMNSLFEDYIRRVLQVQAAQDSHRSKGLQVSERGQLRAFLCYDSEMRGVYEELPDIGIYRNGRLVQLLDAKYKDYDFQSPEKEDIRQLSLYLFSFKKFGIGHADLVYPGSRNFSSYTLASGETIGLIPINLAGNWSEIQTRHQRWAESILSESRGL
jgi:5-methylcytosine-specific restriction endonuclease McrBC regulatory subunit McrC